MLPKTEEGVRKYVRERVLGGRPLLGGELTRLLCGGGGSGGDVDAVLRACGGLLASKVCPAVWGDGTWFYRCRTCQTSPSSCVCVDCFRAGDHRGHEAFLEMSHVGGTCDCGCADAWKPSGNCPRHGHASDDVDPVPLLPDFMRVQCPAVLQETLSCALLLLRKAASSSSFAAAAADEDANGAAMAAVRWLRAIGGKGEVFLRILRRFCVANSPDCFRELVETLPDLAASAERHALLEETVGMLLDLIQDAAVKSAFAPLMPLLYERVIADPALDDAKLGLVHKIAPQLLNMPTIARDLAVPAARTCKSILAVIGEHSPVVFRRVVAIESLIHKRAKFVFAFIADFERVIEFDEVREALAQSSSMEYIDAWTRFPAELQGYDAMLRKTGDHVEFEQGMGFLSTLSFELESLQCAGSFAKAYGQSPEKAKAAVAHAAAPLGSWILGQENCTLASVSRIDDAEFLDISIGSIPVSAQLPLHRNLAKLISELLANNSSLRLEDLFEAALSACGGQVRPDMLFEHPIQLQAWVSQAAARLWARNGEVMVAKAGFYCNLFLDFLNQADLFSVQIHLAMLGPDALVATLLSRFGVSGIVAPDEHPSPEFCSSQASPQQRGALAADMLGLLVSALQDRTHVSPRENAKGLLRRELLHQLAVGDRLRSDLVRDFSRHMPSEAEVDEIAAELADWVPPTETRPGYFKLREEFWPDFDPWFRHFDNRHLQQALEHQAEATKGKRGLAPLWSSHAKLPDAVEPFASAFHKLLSSKLLHKSLRLFVSAARRDELGSEMLMHAVLRLMWLLTENCDVAEAANGNEELHGLLEELFASVRAPPKCIAGNQRAVESLSAVLHKFAESLPFVREMLSALDRRGGSSAESSTLPLDKKEIARRRQAAMLESMRRQQAAFAEKQHVEAAAAEETPALEDESAAQLCVLCRQEAKHDHVLALIAHAQRSNIPWIAKRRECFPGEYGSVAPDGKWTLPARASHTQRSDAWMEGLWADCNEHVRDEFQNMEQGASLQITGCLHVVHFDCFERYFQSVALRFQGFSTDQISAKHGDFLCPICRCIANVVIPLLPHPSVVAPLVYSEDWISSLSSASVAEATLLSGKDEALPLADLAVRVNCSYRSCEMSDVNVTNVSFPLLLNVASGAIMGAEVALRSRAELSATYWPRQHKILSELVNSCLVARCIPVVRLMADEIWKWLVIAPLNGMAPLYPQSIISPRTDLFSVLVRLMLLVSPEHRGDVLCICSAAAVTQSFLHLALAKQCVTGRHLALPVVDAASNPDDVLFAEWFHLVQSTISRSLICRDLSEAQCSEPVAALLAGTCSFSSFVSETTSTFRRRAGLLLHVLAGTPGDIPDLDALQLPRPAQLFGTGKHKQLISEWCWQHVSMATRDGRPTGACLPLAPAPAPLRFIPLPPTFQDLVVALSGKVCMQCGTQPKSAFLCLACGAIECTGLDCCGGHRCGAMAAHAGRCGAGVCVGVLLDLTYSAIYQGHLHTRIHSLFRDSFGEDDPHLRHGRLLELNTAARSRLEQEWVTMGFFLDSPIIDNTRVDMLHNI